MTLGPAIVPSLVTWATKNKLIPNRLAKLTSALEQCLIWFTDPAGEGSVSLLSVWRESITTSEAFELGRTFSRTSSLVSQKILILLRCKPRRWARIFTCEGDSSPLT